MIVVTGTKSSGAVQWMRLLEAAGLPVVGGAPSYNSPLTRGIYYATNPHPVTGKWLPPQASRHLGAKMFVPGTLRSELAYLDHVIVSVRPFRQWIALLERQALRAAKKEGAQGQGAGAMPHLDPILEWWLENYLIARDVAIRGYPTRFVALEKLLTSPEAVVKEIFSWLDAGNLEEALSLALAQKGAENADRGDGPDSHSSEGEHPQSAVFDEFYRRVLEGEAMDAEFMTTLGKTHEILLPQIKRGLNGLSLAHARRRERLRSPASPEVDALDDLFHPEPELSSESL